MGSSRIGLALGGLVLALLVGCVALSVATRDLQISYTGFLPVMLLTFAGVGVVVARRQPENPIGWIMLAVALASFFETDVRLYLVLDYRIHHGTLPLGQAALYWNESYSLLPLLFGLPAILLFPDGRLPARWRRRLRVYLGLGVVFMVCQFAGETTVSFGARPRVALSGHYAGNAGTTGLVGQIESWSWLLGPVFLAFWLSFVGYQFVAWRRSTGERHEQLKWLAVGAACCVVGAVGVVLFGDGSALTDKLLAVLAALAISAFPLSIGVGILKYRLYEIDRLISRTLSYAILTGLLVGVFIGFVALATDVLPFSSPVGVAASTLAAAALFHPLRLRVQRLVDRRFNRSRYDADAIVTAFTLRLRDAVDLDTVRDELLLAVDRAVEPAHASVWIRPSVPRARV
jgi:hypothetical protein